jgi:hypothetical protein
VPEPDLPENRQGEEHAGEAGEVDQREHGAGGEDEQRVRAAGAGDCIPHRRVVAAAAEAAVDDASPARAREAEGVDDAGVEAAAGCVKDAQGHQRDVPIDACDTRAVVADGADRPGDVRAMTVGVGRIAVARDEVVSGHEVREVLVRGRDPCIDDGDLDRSAAGGDVPRRRRADLLETPEGGVLRVVRGRQRVLAVVGHGVGD